jgi:polynucleotide 5'-hydroxyl-kinase GRC3/NOL9
LTPFAGPPFTHPRHPFKAHFTGSNSVKSLSKHYFNCVKSLIETYKLDIRYQESEEYQWVPSTQMESDMPEFRGIPLVVNTFGWTKGLGGELIHQIESHADLSHLVSFRSLSTDMMQANQQDIWPGLEYMSLEPVEAPQSSQNQVDKRSLMTMSYFHSQLYEEDNTNYESLHKKWITDIPLCAMTPWEVSWATALDHIILIGNGSEVVDISEVLRVLNGAIVALVEMDPLAERLSSQSNLSVPYIQGAGPPDPTTSQCVGYALIRSVRASTKTLHVITPVPADRLRRVRALVMGEIHLPIWGMLDHRVGLEQSSLSSVVDLNSAPFLYWTDMSQNLPGSRILRVRRNLMRKSQI